MVIAAESAALGAALSKLFVDRRLDVEIRAKLLLAAADLGVTRIVEISFILLWVVQGVPSIELHH